MRSEQPAAPLIRWRGRMEFAEAFAQQESLVRTKWRDPAVPDEMWFLEHDPVYTIGRTPDRSSLRRAAHLPHPLFQINRGGQATWHGPGQLVGYFLLDLRRYGQDLHRYLRWIETLLVTLLARYDVVATTRAGLTGVWIGQRKIVSIGVGVRHWITMHGFALNVAGDLSAFEHITPCGIADVAMTSIEKETGVRLPLAEVAAAAAQLARRAIVDLPASASPSTAPHPSF
ncbi:MAG TPA: lipoyl(octanoyl) transferase LipB [Chthoniobacterales bacterium]